MDLNKIFNDLKKSKWVWAIYIPLTIPVNLFLTFYGGCFASILVALTTFGIPYLFGVRSVKTFLKAGTLLIIITGILFGALYTYFMYNQTYLFESKTVNDMQLLDGSVTPYLGDENSYFNYTVSYVGTESPSNITVYVNITGLMKDYDKNINLIHANGLYYNETVLEEDLYLYHFAVHSHNTNTWNETEVGFGPITLPFSDMLGSQILQGVIILFLNTGLMFYFILVLFWWTKKAKQDRKKLYGAPEAEEEEKAEEREEETEEEFEEEGKEGGKDEEFEEEIEEEGKIEAKGEYTCTACGADVDGDATKCPNCGEEFEGEDEGD